MSNEQSNQSVTYVWNCCNCNFTTDEFYGNARDRVTYRETIRILVNKEPQRLCLQCINSGIRLERKTQDMKDFMSQITERRDS